MGSSHTKYYNYEKKKKNKYHPHIKLKDRQEFYETGRTPMVGWFASQLFKTGLDLLISTKLSSSHDVRMLNALQRRRRGGRYARLEGEHKPTQNIPFRRFRAYIPHEDESKISATDETEKKEMWFDFMADIGDGFDSCYTVTYLQTRPNLFVQDPLNLLGGGTVPTTRGEVLILGGDLAYPAPTVESYDLRFKKLYEMAFPWSGADVPGCESLGPTYSPRCYAIPGNHDWYDSLTIFSALFLRGRSVESIESEGSSSPSNKQAEENETTEAAAINVWLGGYTLGQDQTYFALKLPHDWWMFGIDLGLYNDIDIMQLRYFLGVCLNLTQYVSNIIIVCHEPLWWFRGFKEFPMNIKKLLKDCKHQHLQVRLWLAGDIHSYRRDSHVSNHRKVGINASSSDFYQTETTKPSQPQFHKVISGGGGAFLHPTWVGLDNNGGHKDGKKIFVKQAVFPSTKTCYWLAFKNLFFPFYNLSFGLITSALYTLLLWWAHDQNGDPASFFDAFFKFRNPMPTCIFTVFGLGCVYFANGSSIQKIIQGGLHFMAHIAGFNAVWYFSKWLAARSSISAVQTVATAASYIGGGYVVGSFIMGLYLLASALVGTHWNEAYGSIKCEDYKSFVRLHISTEGDLELFAIGIDKANKKWEVAPDSKDDYKSPLIKPTQEYIGKAKLVDYIKINKHLDVNLH